MKDPETAASLNEALEQHLIVDATTWYELQQDLSLNACQSNEDSLNICITTMLTNSAASKINDKKSGKKKADNRDINYFQINDNHDWLVVVEKVSLTRWKMKTQLHEFQLRQQAQYT